MSKAGIYIHVPFCEKKCDYCSFCSVGLGEVRTATQEFTDRLCIELTKELSGRTIEADSIYFGGGTPTILNYRQFEKIFNTLSKHLIIDANSEITVEINPVHAEKEKLGALTSLGVNRFSLGIQTLDRSAYTFLGRHGGFADASCLDEYFSLDVIHSVDFISGIHTGLDSSQDIKKILPYAPEHLSVYLLSVDNGTPLYDRFKPEEGYDAYQRSSYLSVSRLLEDAGYDHYEISNFSRDRYRARHNSKYWNYESYLGFGPGAHSFFEGGRYFNRCSVDAYLEGENVRETDERSDADAVIEFFMTALRTSDGAHEKRFEAVFGRSFPEEIIQTASLLDSMVLSGSVPLRKIQLKKEAWVYLDSIVFTLVEGFLP